jgi:lipopolysaccharide export system protein LptA
VGSIRIMRPPAWLVIAQRARRPILPGAAAGLLLLLTLPAAAAPAQPASPPGGDRLPVHIEADSGIEWDQTAHVYIARGNAVATRGPSEVHADTLVAHYRDVKGGGNAGDKTEIYRLDADGHVEMHRNDDTVVGDHGVYDVDQEIAVVTGKGLKLTTPTDVVTARDSLEWYDQKNIAVARGDAVAVRNGRTVKGDVLTAYLRKEPAAAGTKPGPGGGAARGKPTPTLASVQDPDDAGASKISRVDAQGHVAISNPVETGRGDFGVYNADTGIATLIGNVVIERGKDVIRGQRGVMDLNRNISRMLPGGALGNRRVQGLFVRDQQHADGAGQSPGPAAKPAVGGKAP